MDNTTKTNNSTTGAISISNILSKDQYIIPLYQRNYSWGQAEIEQLIRDISDSSKTNNSYYLGTLVCFKREDDKFELIDGQQRHTTLTLINIVLGATTINLDFDARPNNKEFFDWVIEKDLDNELGSWEDKGEGVEIFIDAIKIIKECLKDEDKKEFRKYFEEKVKLFRVEVPEGTNLNHYFEIMNNRGEQLEKHEILKASLMNNIEGNEGKIKTKKLKIFALIWDACADMSNYVWSNFNNEKRKEIFQNNGDFKEYKKNILKFEIDTDNINDSDSSDEPKEKFRSVIDFPNFLLQVLKLSEGDTVTLDDKKLLDNFGYPNKLKVKAEKFIDDLITYRVLFDQYIIKQDLTSSNEDEQKWGLRTFKFKKDTDNLVKTFDKNDDEELVMLQTMLYYSSPTKSYNYWVQDILENIEKNIEENDKDYKNILTSAEDYAKEKFDKTNLSYPHIPVYNFYYIEYLLWKEYYHNVRGDKQVSLENKKNNNIISIIDKNRGLFADFRFRQLNSKEHLLSKSEARILKIDTTILNCLGNLCLISTSQNSQANKGSTLSKKGLYKEDNPSLKCLIMVNSFKENNDWNTEKIEEHYNEIKDLLSNYEITIPKFNNKQ